MALSQATTVKEYLDALPDDRRRVIAKVRAVIRKHLPAGYEEKLNAGIISYQVPLKTLADTYNGSRCATRRLRHRRITTRCI